MRMRMIVEPIAFLVFRRSKLDAVWEVGLELGVEPPAPPE